MVYRSRSYYLLFNIGKLFSGLDTISDLMLRIWIESEKIC